MHKRRFEDVYAIALWERTDPRKSGPGYLAIVDGKILTFVSHRDAGNFMKAEFADVPKSQRRVVKLVPKMAARRRRRKETVE